MVLVGPNIETLCFLISALSLFSSTIFLNPTYTKILNDLIDSISHLFTLFTHLGRLNIVLEVVFGSYSGTDFYVQAWTMKT